MALAPYHRRAALAAAQLLEGFDEHRFAEALGQPVGISFGSDAVASAEGRALVDLSLRLVARLYPTIELRATPGAEEHGAHLVRLARKINPEIALGESDTGIVVGGEAEPFAESVFAGSEGWDALVSTETKQSIAEGSNTLGAGASACLAAANLFRAVVLPPESRRLDTNVRYSTFHLDRSVDGEAAPALPPVEIENAAAIGIGAIGNAVAWALAHSAASGAIDFVDPESVELSNLQRYVLTTTDDVDRVKVEVGAEALRGGLLARPHRKSFAQYIAEHGSAVETIAVSVDNRRDRIAVQASLPRVALNGWTQPGDLGVSIHPHFGQSGACINCLYLPDGVVPNDDELVAHALGIPERSREVRTLLATGAPPPPELLDAIAAALNVSPESVHAYSERNIRDLYSEGICGGAVLPLSAAGRPAADMHVPLAHQSALAGVLLAARLLRHAAGFGPTDTRVSRLNVLQPVGLQLTQPMQRVTGRRCLCGDGDFVRTYERKWADRSG